MKRFDFPLERVRRWRSEQLDLEELKLQQILGERQSLARSKQRVRDELEHAQRELLAHKSLEPGELESLDSFRQYIRGCVRNIEAREQECEARIAAQRQRVIAARQQFELLDRLRQKALAEWRAAADREQETMAAELFLAKTVRNVH